MRFLLPPSESKRDGLQAAALEMQRLLMPELAPARDRAVKALARFCAKPSPRVRAAIGTTPRQDAELARNALIAIAPTGPAHAIYDGILFNAIELPTASSSVQRKIVERTLVQSALFGIVAFDDPIPAYRCSADSTLPRIGTLAAHWRPHLRDAMAELLRDEFVIDMRSGAYATMWRVPESITNVLVKVVQDRDGKRIAVSHANKATKGHLVRALCEQRTKPTSADALAEACERAGFDVRLVAQRTLEVVAV